jgi:hypothetical protein
MRGEEDRARMLMIEMWIATWSLAVRWEEGVLAA